MSKFQDPANQNPAPKPSLGPWRLARPSAWAKKWFRDPWPVGRLSSALALIILFLFCHRSSGQSYSIDWHKISGGGGTSGGGSYSLNGTIGQPEAGTVLTGGAYSLAGGFWSLYSAPTPGMPSLHVFLSGTNTAVVWWPSPSAGWALQQNSSLAATNWVSAADAINDDGRTKSIVVQAPAARRFYRLANP